MVAATKCKFPWRIIVSSVAGKANTLCEAAFAQHVVRLACSIFFGFERRVSGRIAVSNDGGVWYVLARATRSMVRTVS